MAAKIWLESGIESAAVAAAAGQDFFAVLAALSALLCLPATGLVSGLLSLAAATAVLLILEESQIACL
jgi:hypothetical protein